jgi:ACDE family multidrug resistance protein
MFHRRPSGISTLGGATGTSLATLSALEGASRAMLVGIVPLIALQAVGSKEAVSWIYLSAAIFTLTITLNFSVFERVLQRRWVLSLSGLFIVCAAILFYFAQGWLFALGIGLRSAAASLFSVCLSLYVMEYINKSELTWTESRRVAFGGAAWLVSPTLGLWLWSETAEVLPFVISAIMAMIMVAFFWRLRLGGNKVVQAAKKPASNALKVVPRYFQQKRLRIAYFITLTRSCFWLTLFIYGPIYVVESGLPQWMAGGLLSAVAGLMFISPFIRDSAERYGTRNVIIFSLLLTSGSLAALGFIGEARPFGLVFWLLGAFGGVCLDLLANIPFMRMVKPRERTEMTIVFSTWREMSELLTQMIIIAVVFIWPFHVFYYVLAAMMLIAAYGARNLPKRL